VRGIGLESKEVREPSPWEENVLMHVGIPSERWVCATLVVSCRLFTRPYHRHHTNQAPQKAPPHSTHYSAHNLSIKDTFFRLGCLGVHSGAPQRLHRAYWELTALISGLHRNGRSGAAGCTGGRVTSYLPWSLAIQIRCAYLI
jgi:hypothetical protein